MPLRWFLPVLLLLISGTIPAQSTKKDSLQTLLGENLSTESRVSVLCELASLYWVSKPDSALYCSREALKQAEKSQHKPSMALALRHVGLSYLLQGDNNLAINFLNRSLHIYSTIKDQPGLSTVLNNLGNLYFEKGDAETSFEYFSKSLKIRESLGDAREIAAGLQSVGQAQQKIADYEGAIESFSKAIKIYEFLSNIPLKLQAHNSLGQVYMAQEDYEAAGNQFEISMDLAEKTGDLNYKAISQMYIGQAHLARNEFVDAYKYLTASLNLARDINFERIVFQVLMSLSEYEQKTSNLEEAMRLVKEAKSIAEEQNNLSGMVKTSQMLATLYSKSGDYDMAYATLKKSLEYSAQLEAAQITDHALNTRLLRQELDYARYHQSDVLHQSIQNKNYWVWIFALVAGVLVLITLLLVFANIKLRKSTKIQIEKKKQEIVMQQQALEKQAEDLSELVAIKDKVFSIIAHDLRTPMKTLKGLLELVENDLVDEKELRTFLAQVEKNVDQTSSLLENLLIWASTQMRGLKLNPETCVVNDIVNDCISLYRHQAEKKNLILDNSIELPYQVFTDRESLKFVIRNLISNAIKYTPEGGTIVTYAMQEGSMLRIVVADSGIGIPGEVLDKLFKKELKTTLGTAKERGFGLGLILCKDIIERNGGSISVQSEHGKGSSFTISLPLQLKKKPEMSNELVM